ncbi:hypothetical protein [Myceligenerans xiligouense]|nr:hypothetical protein [Myceligenerans xiligouense]
MRGFRAAGRAAAAVVMAAGLVGAAATGAGASVVTTDGAGDGSLNVLNNVCVAPWYWEGPGNANSTGNLTEYIACNGEQAELGGDGSVNVLNNVCLLPWHWDGPLNLFSTGNMTEYMACNSSAVS